ncbi:MAG: hypothetical protein R3345_12410 [Fulvivirga sp.]|nr:hypothetical protein [Fulvivirga sp.]
MKNICHYIMVLFVITSCSDEETLMIDRNVALSSIEVDIHGSDEVNFTANAETIRLTATVLKEGAQDSEFLKGLWYNEQGEVLKYDSTNITGFYKLVLDELSSDFHTIYFRVTNSGGQSKEDSIVLNNRPYVNLEYPAVGQRSSFEIYESCTDELSKAGSVNWEITAMENTKFTMKEIIKMEGERVIEFDFFPEDSLTVFPLNNAENTSYFFVVPYYFLLLDTIRVPFNHFEKMDEIIENDCYYSLGCCSERFEINKSKVFNKEVQIPKLYYISGTWNENGYMLNQYNELVSVQTFYGDFGTVINTFIRVD